MKPIEKNEDLVFLIDSFYGKVLKDDLLASFFIHFDMKQHMPKMVQFWAFVLLDVHGYKGNVIEKHIQMPLKGEHFDRWVKLFEETLDAYFEGEKVQLAKQKIAVLRWSMESKIERK